MQFVKVISVFLIAFGIGGLVGAMLSTKPAYVFDTVIQQVPTLVEVEIPVALPSVKCITFDIMAQVFVDDPSLVAVGEAELCGRALQWPTIAGGPSLSAITRGVTNDNQALMKRVCDLEYVLDIDKGMCRG